MGIAMRRAGQHHARPVVVREHQRLLDRPRGHDDRRGADGPEALARQVRRRLGEMVGDALDQPDRAVIVEPEGGAARHQRHPIAEALQRCQPLRHPIDRRTALDRLVLAQQGAAEAVALVAQDDAGPGLGRGQSGAQPGRAAAHHQHVAEGVAALVAVGVGLRRRGAEPGGAADDPLIDRLPERGRPHEGLVVEAGREHRGQHAVDHAQRVEAQRRPAVLALRHQPVIQLDHGGAGVGLVPPAGPQLDQRVRLLRPGGEDAARPVVLEAAADQPDAVGQQGRGQRVAGMAFVALPVEPEAEPRRPVDQPALGQAMRGHRPLSAAGRRSGSAAVISWVSVSRVTRIQDRQP